MRKEKRGRQEATVSRRKFLMGAAALTAVGATALTTGCAANTSIKSDEEVTLEDPTEYKFVVCHTNCTGKCPIRAYMVDGKVTHLEAAEYAPEYPEYKRLCIRGMNHLDLLYGSNRLQYPLRRVEGTKRGDDQWEQITWDEAIEEICAKWQAYIGEFGPSSIHVTNSGGNNEPVKMCTYKRLFSMMGAVSVGSANDNNNFVAMTNSLGSGPYWNGNEYADAINAKSVIFWSRDFPINANAWWNGVLDWQAAGVKMVVIDPSYSIEAGKADTWLALEPGTDNVLVHALMNYLVSNDLIDKEFLKAHTVAPFLVKPDGTYLRQSDQGIEIAEDETDLIMVLDSATGSVVSAAESTAPDLFGKATVKLEGQDVEVTSAFNLLVERLQSENITIDQAVDECKLTKDEIIGLANTLVDGPVTIICGYGIDHYYNGYYTSFGIMTLAMLTGNLGKHGAGAGDKLNSWSNIMNYAYMVPALDEKAVSVAGGVRAGLSIKIHHLPSIFETGYYGDTQVTPKALFAHCVNLYSTHCQGDYWKEVLDKYEFIVVVDMVPTETTKYADIVLPASHWFEYQDVAGYFNNVTVAELNDKVHEPLFESKPDFRIAQLLAKGMGYGEAFAHESEAEIIDAIFDTDVARSMGVTYEELSETHYAVTVPRASDGGYYVYAEDGVYFTPTGRAQFYLEKPTPEDLHEGLEFDAEAARLPYLMRPLEVSKDNPQREKYPLVCWTENSRYRLHTMWDRSPWLRELDPEPFCLMNPSDARVRNIEDGDWVKVYNDRGFSVQKVRFSEGVRPGVIRISKGWPRETFKAGFFQNLTNSAYEPFNINQNYFDCVVEAEKYEEA